MVNELLIRANAKLICVKVSAEICSGVYTLHARDEDWTAQPYDNNLRIPHGQITIQDPYLVVSDTTVCRRGLIVATTLETGGITVGLTPSTAELYL